MKKTFTLWKTIIANPFEGFKGVGDSTKILFPLLTIILLFVFSISMMVPLMLSDSYGDAIVRSQVKGMIEKGNEISLEQQNAMADQIKSPMVRNITIVSAYAGGLITFFLITLFTTFLLKVFISLLKKEKVKFSLVFKVILFASLITMVQSIVKAGVTLTGDWHRVLARVNDTSALQHALQSSISVAALLDPAKVGNSVYFLIDAFTDIFNWLYYVFLYAGLKSALELERKQALAATIVTALLSIGIGFAFAIFI